MGCTKCKTETCSGCGEQALSINDICNPVSCPVSECPESFNANCTFYMGEDIVCNNVVIVPQGTSMAQAIANMSAYFCSQMGVNFITGDNIQITIDVDGNSVIDTNRPLLRKLVATGAFPDADTLGITIPRATLAACGIPTDPCNGATAAFSDFLIQGYWFNPDISEWIKFTELDKTTINVNATGDIIIVSSIIPLPSNFPIDWRVTIIG
jgi:hypothetical protein